MKMKGQYTIVALVMTFVAIVVFIGIYPVLNTFIAEFVAESDDEMTIMMIQLLPFLIITAIIVGFLWYVIPQR